MQYFRELFKFLHYHQAQVMTVEAKESIYSYKKDHRFLQKIRQAFKVTSIRTITPSLPGVEGKGEVSGGIDRLS